MATKHYPPPTSDELLDRHQFYAKASCGLNQAEESIEALRLETVSLREKLESVAEVVKMYATRGNTIIAGVSVLWVLLGGILTTYVNSVISDSQHTVATINDLGTRLTLLESVNTANAEAISSIDKIKRNIATLQKELDEPRP